MYVIMENLQSYLRSQPTGQPLFLGRRFRPPGDIEFNSGGPGYLLNSAALQVLGPHLDSPQCHPDFTNSWEDYMIASCLKTLGIVPEDTRDQTGAERFHPFSPAMTLKYNRNSLGYRWFTNYTETYDRSVLRFLHVHLHFSTDVASYRKEGLACCSEHSVSFHFCNARLIRQLDYMLYDCRP